MGVQKEHRERPQRSYFPLYTLHVRDQGHDYMMSVKKVVRFPLIPLRTQPSVFPAPVRDREPEPD